MSSLALSVTSAGLVAAESVYNASAAQRNLVRFVAQDGDNATLCVFDLSKQETYKHAAKATRLPVEFGPDVTDHIVKDPFGLELECMITDAPFRDDGDDKAQWNDPSTYDRQLATEAGLTAVAAIAGPLGIIAAAVAYSTQNSQTVSRSMRAYETLIGCYNQSRLLTVKTKLGTYKNMVVENLSVPRDSKTGDSLSFSVSLTQLNIVTAQSVSASDVANARVAMAKKKMGTQQNETKEDLFQKGKVAGDADAGEAVKSVANVRDKLLSLIP